MTEYIIKKKYKNHYLVGIEKNKKGFVSFYSENIEKAFRYETYSDASIIVVFLNGINEEELEIIEIHKDNNNA
jgi:hypothetical protein